MQIKVIHYDPIKGKGSYLTSDGEQRSFYYHQFYEEKMFTGVAELYGSKIFKKGNLFSLIKWFFRRLRHGYRSK